MNELLVFFGVAAVLAAALANIGIWSPRRLWVKLAAVTIVALFLPMSFGAYSELLSRPKPVAMEWAKRTVPQAVVLGSRIVEDEAIYLWLSLDGVAEPRAYQLPWSKELAKQLHRAQRQAQTQGRNLMMGRPFEKSADELERVFYSEPHQPPPAKQATNDQGPMIFQGSN